MTAAGIDLNATLSAVARYRYGDERKPLHALQELVLYANSLAGNDPQGFRGGLADRMAALLTSPDATPAAKIFVCGQLADIATEKQAAAVNGLLANTQLAADAALRTLERIPGSTVDRMLRDALGTLEVELNIGVVRALGTRRDQAATEALIAMLAGADETLAGARNSLVHLRGLRINEVLTGLLSEDDASRQAEVIRILAARNAVSSLAALEKAAEATDGTVRKEAWKALGSLARTPDAAALLELLLRVRDEERDEAEKAVAAVLRRPDRTDLRAVLQKLETVEAPAARGSLIRLVSAVGDDSALPALRKAVESGDAGLRDAAVRGLAAWPTPTPFEDLMNLARTAPESVHRVLALRAAIRLSSEAEGPTPEQMTGRLTELMQLAGVAAERKAVLAELGQCPTLDALRLAQKCLADPELATEAGVAVTQIAPALRDIHGDQVLAALQQLLAGNRDTAIAARAFKVLKDILKPVNLALGATATSPDGLDPDGTSGGDKAAIDGDSNTYWDEVDGADLYRLKMTLKEPQDVSSIDILWHPYEEHQAKNLDVLCDGKVVAEVRKAKCFENEMFIAFPSVRCTSVELVIPGKNGLVSPAIHEFQIFSHFPPQSAGSGDPRRTEGSPPRPEYAWKQTDAALALLNHDRVVWQFNHAANQAKAYFHPVALTDGTSRPTAIPATPLAWP